MRLEDIEQRRQDEVLLNGLGAQRLPDPTTAGDFTRRFAPADILELQECVNRTRQRVLSVQRGEVVLFEDVRYFFYLTNRRDLTAAQVVGLANGRCDQENVIEQLKNGVNAMRMPVDNLESNWAYMVMAALAWNLKAWFALLVPERARGLELLRMEFRRFLHAVMLVPCPFIALHRTSTPARYLLAFPAFFPVTALWLEGTVQKMARVAQKAAPRLPARFFDPPTIESPR